MLYLGGKGRIGGQIAETILANTNRRSVLLEPFLGGGNSFEHLAPHFANTMAGDLHEDLMLMWQAAREGWIPPDVVSEEEYLRLRNEAPSALRGFVGFGCSFGGKWWGGYARNAKIRKAGHRPRNYAGESSRAVIRTSRMMQTTTLRRAAFDEWDVPTDAVVYADPPYDRTTGYRVSFDRERFWSVMKSWSLSGARVFVSEYAAPTGWIPIWSRETREAMFTNRPGTKTENLFVLDC